MSPATEWVNDRTDAIHCNDGMLEKNRGRIELRDSMNSQPGPPIVARVRSSE